VPAQHVETARMLVRLWNEGVREPPTELLDPQVELASPFAALHGEPYRGHEGIAQWVRDVDEQFSEWRVEEREVSDVDGAVLSLGTLHGRGRASGIEIDQQFAFVLQFGADDRIARIRIYWDLDAARADLGLPEAR
jgi:ketosteroid isomerase-like protein